MVLRGVGYTAELMFAAGAKRILLPFGGAPNFIKVFYLDSSQRPFGCNTPVTQNGLRDDWLPRPTADRPKRYAFFLVEPASPAAPDPLLGWSEASS